MVQILSSKLNTHFQSLRAKLSQVNDGRGEGINCQVCFDGALLKVRLSTAPAAEEEGRGFLPS